MIQPFFDYACSAWYSNIIKELKMRLEAAQNKCIKLCLKLNDRPSIKSKEFEKNKLVSDSWKGITMFSRQCLQIFYWESQ